MQDFGYDQNIFNTPVNDQFECPICNLIAKQPKECQNCGAVFCSSCIDQWTKKKLECPKSRCDFSKKLPCSITGALLRIYINLDIKCPTKDCGKLLKLGDYDNHILQCQIPKCTNHSICNKSLSLNVKDRKTHQNQSFCDDNCILLFQIIDCKQDWKKVLEILQKRQVPEQIQIVQQQPLNWKWDKNVIGNGIEVQNNGTAIFLQEAAYMFRTCLGDTPFMQGCHYWEITLDQRTQNELKIGVASKKDFNLNSSFCDYDFGYAYYGLGQLRHNSNAAGPQYGRRFKNEGTLGCYLDMNNGTLSFALNGEYFGISYQSNSLKQGPIYPAVSLLHCAGCKLTLGKQVPQYFLKAQQK